MRSPSRSTTEKLRSKLFRVALVPGIALGACSSRAPLKTVEDLHLSPLKLLRTEVNKPVAVDGSIVIVRIQLPEELRATDPEKIRAEYLEREIPFYPMPERGPGEYEAVVPVPYNHSPGDTQIVVKVGTGADAKGLTLPVRVEGGDYRAEVLKVAPKHVKPPAKYGPRIEREVKMVVQLYERLTRRKYWKGPFQLPIQSEVTSPFGSKRVYNGELANYHGGLDLKAAVGTPIHASAAGEVVMAQNLYYTGNTVLIDHGYGVFTLYAHMTKLKVKKGQEVEAGQLLGLSGMTGRVTGPHLHWQAIVRRVKINPWELTQVMQ